MGAAFTTEGGAVDIHTAYTLARDLLDWVPDTLWDSVFAMLALYGAVLVGVVEVNLWLDRRSSRT